MIVFQNFPFLNISIQVEGLQVEGFSSIRTVTDRANEQALIGPIILSEKKSRPQHTIT